MRLIPWIQGVVVAVLLAAVLTPPLYALFETLSGLSASSQEARLHLNTKNSTRYSADSPLAIARAAAGAIFLPEQQALEVAFNDWRAVAAAAPLAQLGNRALVPADSGGIDAFRAQLDALEAYANSPAYPGVPRHALVISDADPLLAAPLVGWSSFSGAPLLIDSEEGLADDIVAGLQDLGLDRILIGPGVGDETVSALEDVAPVQRVGSSDAFENALEFAQFQIEGSIGWGFGTGDADPAFHNFFLASQDSPELAVFAGALAGRGKTGPLLLTNTDAPERLEAFLWELKPDWIVTPAAGPFNHMTILASPEMLSWQQQGELDWASEIKNYVTQGEGLSSLDAVIVGWIILSLCCGAWLVINAIAKQPMMPPAMRMVWGLLGVLLGPFAVAIYLFSYHGRLAVMSERGLSFRRTFFGEVLVATAMGIAFGASIMIATAFFLALFGMPLFVIDGDFYLLGSPMIIMLILMWLLAILIAFPLFQFPMLLMRGYERGAAARSAAIAVVISMSAASLGMMSTNWAMQMMSPLDLAGRGAFIMMQSEESLEFTGALLIAAIVGFLTALPFNAILVSRGWRPGLG